MTETEQAYSRVDQEELILRDHLAAERTVLANERTLLAYVRTALGTFVAGASFVQFFSSVIIQGLGWALAAVSLVALWVGIARYRRVGRDLRRLTMKTRDSLPNEKARGAGGD
jgi:putative membrane protein